MKGASTETIHTAIRSVNEGVAWIDPQIARLVLSGTLSAKFGKVIREKLGTREKKEILGI